jgi:hypothetical protein
MIGSMTRLIKIVRRALVLGALLAVFGNSTIFAASFKADWKEAIKKTPPAGSILGAWEGQWKSVAHHVSGPLRCVIKDKGNGEYEAHFYAQFHWFHFSYAAKLAAVPAGSRTNLNGQVDLGWMGGLYKYVGEASPSRYTSTYRSPVENGVLELARPKST